MVLTTWALQDKLVPADIAADDWSHVAVTFDGSSRAAGLRVYVDGRPVGTRVTHDALTETIRTPKSTLVGRRHGGPSMTGLVDGVVLYDRELTEEEASELARASVRPTDVALRTRLLERLARNADPERREALARHGEAEERVTALRAAMPRVPILRELPPERQRTTHVLARGSFLAPTEPVTPGVPEAFPPLEAEAPDRLDFARWLVDEDNPLTARVQVNRLWSELFGTGLVETAEDFGTQGARPSHPALLDWLARDFVRSGWSWKELCRRVVTSETYRQSSRVRAEAHAKDPRNRLLWRGPRHRLSAEQVRDQALFAAGLLSRKRFGPPVFPPQPEGVWQVIYSGDAWVEAEGEDRWRRGLYTFWRRTSPYPSMTAFDAPSREVCISRRIRTSTPLQALVTLNDPVFVEAARALAHRVLSSETASGPSKDEGARDRARAARAFLWTAGRPASERELEAVLRLLEEERSSYAERREDALRLAGAAELDAPEAAELAAWTVVGNVLLNLDEVLVKG